MCRIEVLRRTVTAWVAGVCVRTQSATPTSRSLFPLTKKTRTSSLPGETKGKLFWGSTGGLNMRNRRPWHSLGCTTVRWLNNLEEAGLTARLFAIEVFVGVRGCYAAAGGAVDHADLHEVGLVHFLDGVFFFA